MNKATLVVMAAGLGSRFGEKGMKQLEPVGPNGESIMEYSIYDAIEAGFDKVVFVIRSEMEEVFRQMIGDRIAQNIQTDYAYQEIADIPAEYTKCLEGRIKPWGTGQAILSCKKVVDSPFLVINADDYYGKQAYIEAYRYLTAERGNDLQICMAGFVLKNTLSENGPVTRGICMVTKDGMLEKIVETRGIIEYEGGAAVCSAEGEIRKINADSPVSMNMWGMFPEFFTILESGFRRFLETLGTERVTAEYLLPTIIGGLLKEKKLKVKVLATEDKWFGITYKEDKEGAAASLRELIAEGRYPETLF